jgi:protease secretion system outer membrane protein
MALRQNPELLAQTTALEVAKQEILKARAGHAPRLDFVASYSKNASETINTYNQDSTVRAIGIQLNVPLYSGGSVNATSRQAVAGLERSRADLQAKTDKALIEVSKQFSAVQSGIAKVNALNRAVESSNLLIKATEQSIKGGVRINLDLLNAQQQLFTTRRDLAQARYAYLMASLRLRAAAGALDVNDVSRTASYFR